MGGFAIVTFCIVQPALWFKFRNEDTPELREASILRKIHRFIGRIMIPMVLVGMALGIKAMKLSFPSVDLTPYEALHYIGIVGFVGIAGMTLFVFGSAAQRQEVKNEDKEPTGQPLGR